MLIKQKNKLFIGFNLLYRIHICIFRRESYINVSF